jgi:xylulokinase
LLLGIDMGTSSCKVIIIDSAGKLVSEASSEYTLLTSKPGWAEQDSDEILAVTRFTIQEAMKNLDDAGHKSTDIRAIAICSPRDSMILVDKRGQAARNCITWMDQRAIPQIEKLKISLHENHIHEVTGHGIETAFWAPKILWIKENEPKVFAKTKRFLSPASYFLFSLTGNDSIHISTASRTMLLDRTQMNWSEAMCELTGISLDLLPETTKEIKIVGETGSDVSSIGLASGTPVTVGLSSDHCAAVGLDAVDEGSLGIMAATNDALYLPVNQCLRLDGKSKGVGCTPHLVSDKWLQHFSISSTSGSIRWFRDNFCYEEREKGEETYTSPFEYMDDLAANSSTGSDGLMFYPYLWGADVPRFNEYASASFIGIRLGHTRSHFIRAIMEGVAFQYIGAFALLDDLGLEVKQVSMGGGGSRSELWNQIKVDMVNKSIRVPEIIEASSLGACLAAGTAISDFQSISAAAEELIRWKKIYHPSEDQHLKYKELYSIYETIFEGLSKHMSKSHN